MISEYHAILKNASKKIHFMIQYWTRNEEKDKIVNSVCLI